MLSCSDLSWHLLQFGQSWAILTQRMTNMRFINKIPHHLGWISRSKPCKIKGDIYLYIIAHQAIVWIKNHWFKMHHIYLNVTHRHMIYSQKFLILSAFFRGSALIVTASIGALQAETWREVLEGLKAWMKCNYRITYDNVTDDYMELYEIGFGKSKKVWQRSGGTG